jgi:MerR family mercuric resistance operon transcriptional regulator/MerR family copper efflux transcriptional regulator
MSSRIGTVARQAGVSVDTVRFYERRGLLPEPEREPSGYRRYRDDAVERIRLTKSLQALGFTLDEVVDALRSFDAGGATCEGERWRLEHVLQRIDGKLTALHQLRHDVVEALELSQTGYCVFCRRDYWECEPAEAASPS